MINMTEEEMKRLIAKCKSCDSKSPRRCAAGKAIVYQYSRLIIKCIRKELRKRFYTYSPQDIEDILHMFYIRIFENNCRRIKQYDPDKGCSVKTWIIMIAMQSVYDHMYEKDVHSPQHRRKRSSNEELSKELQGEGIKNIEARDLLQRLLKVLPRLNPEQRLLIQLHFLDDDAKSLKDISKIMNKSMTAIYQIKFRAIEELKQLLDL